MRSGNPMLNSATFDSFHDQYQSQSNSMTVSGAANKTLILLGLCVGTASMTWSMVAGQNFQQAIPWIFGGAIAGFVFSIATSFKPNWSPYTAPLYALAEGLFLGGLSAVFERQANGIVFQALIATFGTAFALLFAYQTGLIRATRRFQWGVIAATGGIAIMYFTMSILRMFGLHVDVFAMNGIGLAISAVVVIVAALNLILDFAFIEEAARSGAPKYYEWYGAFGLMVTLVWLYVEVLRLLMILSRYFQED